MEYTQCVTKFRDVKGRIIGYRLLNRQGKIIDISNKDLKIAINNKTIAVSNAKIASDGRIFTTNDIGHTHNDMSSKQDDFYVKLVNIFSQAYEESNTDARIFILKGGDIHKPYGCELIVGFRRKTNSANKLFKNKADYLLVRIYTNKLGNYTVHSPLGIWRIAGENEVITLLSDLLKEINSYANNRNTVVIGIDDSNIMQYRNNNALHMCSNNISDSQSNIIAIGGNVLYIEPKDINLRNYVIPRYVTTISVNAFDRCKNLESIKVYTRAQYDAAMVIRNSTNLKFKIIA